MKRIKQIVKWCVIIIAILSGLFAAGIVFLTIREYRPSDVEVLSVSNGSKKVNQDTELTVITYNIGYAALGSTEDFFMDGGTKVRPDNKEVVEKNLLGNANVMKSNPADIYFLQEVDINSKRSYHINEMQYLEKALQIPGMFSYNFKCDYIPYPIPTIGHVEAGLVTLTDLEVNSASRISLPESFRWPLKICNLKRALLEARIPIEGTKKELVLFNLHLEAYDSGAGKIAQSKMLADILEKEYEKGNYVIAGGDFNQMFEGYKQYPILEQGNWMPGIIGKKDIADTFSFAVDDSIPTCRMLNGPYTGSYETSQMYIIDGFIVSNNIQVQNVNVIPTEFQYSDHQPVKLTFKFK
ncbi:endonuclease/exonuclease/phosphatase family protein [Anaerocolumna xylanovorans]|uniref:Metal-dependent hydrolase, endonuclease/exonuclease/phosphatase family n=1 Tax=Anaerocolumna xylanovorans DSM 12503 TaxID=1121345 RepID=A0A1M7YN25_9FIRM|nr:endonuclease [Anaerocolumna xylanovorans]SHO54030.1 Metal-dependent hydrolase, endonuclease/exonuclease/phosphatase family [Anaerocolumna xylanovorans DSM 12503]